MRYTPGIINDTAVVLEDGKIAVVEEICLKLNDYGLIRGTKSSYRLKGK